MVDCVKGWFLRVWKPVFVLEVSLGRLLSCFNFSLFLLVHLYVLHCKLHSGYPYVFLHIQAQVIGEVDILHGSEMRDDPSIFLSSWVACFPPSNAVLLLLFHVSGTQQSVSS